MANSKLTVNFTGEMLENDFISFEVFNNLTNNVILLVVETWKVSRRASFEIPTLKIADSNNVAQNFILYFDIDYNGSNLFTINYLNETQVEIIANSNKYTFQELFYLGNINASIINTTDNVTAFEVLSYSINPIIPTNPCEDFIIRIESDGAIESYILDGVLINITPTETLDITYPRGVDFKIRLFDSVGKEINYPSQTNVDINNTGPFNKSYFLPKFLVSDLNIQVNSFINGSTVILNVNESSSLTGELIPLIKEYSLDNISWFSSNIFSGQLDNDYTAYVRDNYGCKISKTFIVDSVSTRKPIFSISKANAFNFIKIEQANGIDIFENEDNTFINFNENLVPYCIPQIFNNKDEPFLQIKSNHNLPQLFIRKYDGTENELVFEKMSNNIDRFLRLDCFAYQYSNGNLALYFTQGNQYDELGNIIGQYDLNGNLPDFAIKGNYINVDGLGTFQINSNIIDNENNVKIILTDFSYNGPIIPTKVSSIYNLIDYDIYQHKFDLSDLNEGLYDLLIKTKPIGEDEFIYYLSESFNIATKHDYSLHIKYYNKNTNNRSIFYKFNIKNTVRLFYTQKEGYFLQEQDINVNDDSVKSIRSFLNRGHKFVFDDLTERQMETIVIALSSEFVFINGRNYVKDGEVEVEIIDNTNLYSITAKMLLSSQSFDIEDTGYSGQDELDENIFIPNIITDGTNFIKS